MECITGLKCLSLPQINEIKYCDDLFTFRGEKSKRKCYSDFMIFII